MGKEIDIEKGGVIKNCVSMYKSDREQLLDIAWKEAKQLKVSVGIRCLLKLWNESQKVKSEKTEN
ncbi:MAG: hypothetical protein HC892_10015 [Saprospiraceae bacterium]|nr:hypothetical protein [Saprospiraceae bacterium]